MTAPAERLGAFRVYRRVLGLYGVQWRLLLALAALVFVPVGLAEAVPATIEAGQESVAETVALLAAFLAELSIVFLGTVFFSGMVGGLALERVRGERPAPLQLLRRLPYLRLVGIDVLVTLGTAIGLLLVFVPGIVFVTWSCLAAPLAEMERRSIVSALQRSRQLVRGRFWPVARTILPVWVLVVLAAGVLQSLVSLALGEGLLSEWVATTLALMLTSPLYALTTADLAVELALERGDSPQIRRVPPLTRREGD